MSDGADRGAPAGRAASATVTVAGLATSRGYAAGPVFVYSKDSVLSVPEYAIAESAVESELARYRTARAETRRQIEELVAKFKSDTDGLASDVLSNHLLLLDDPTADAAVERRISAEHLNAEAAIRHTTDDFRALFAKMKDPYLRERQRDVEDLENRLLRILLDRSESAFDRISEPVVVVADDLTPSETVTLPRDLILGFATNRGSTTSHVALLARALGIPAVVGLGDVTSRVQPGDFVLLDGTKGTVTVNPDEAARAAFDAQARRERELRAQLAETGSTPGAAPTVRLCANAQPGVSLAGLAAYGAQGIGLYRSEYLWLGGNADPSEEEQFAAYAEAARAAAQLGDGARVVFRARDIGGDKIQRGQRSHEANPFLGNRSIRFLLSHRDVFRTQLRAILRASACGPSAVMYPMVATVQELRAANEELNRTMDELRAAGVPFDEHIPHGVMIEVPSAALNADAFAQESDFFSIGTNDLVQYTMAADRANERVYYLYQPANPAVIKLVDMAVSAGRAAGISVSVCGESASDPVLGVLWAGLGVTELSMSASYIPEVRKTLQAISADEARELADRVRGYGSSRSAAEIYADCRAFVISKIPQFGEMQSVLTEG